VITHMVIIWYFANVVLMKEEKLTAPEETGTHH
jgi:hypothetical protein